MALHPRPHICQHPLLADVVEDLIEIGLVILAIGLSDYSTLITDEEPMAMMAGG